MYTYIFIILPYKQFTVQRLFNLFLKEVSLKLHIFLKNEIKMKEFISGTSSLLHTLKL